MRRLSLVCVLAALALPALSPAAGTALTPWQLSTRFKQATGDRLVVNRRASYAGHYTALDLGAATISKKARYGTFTVYVVTGSDVEAEVTDLLADGHTGLLGTPGPGTIHWESGTTIYGDRYWLAKRRYGANVVLWWIGSKPVKKTDVTWTRLHRALTRATAAPASS
jgi:hypothetical protein